MCYVKSKLCRNIWTQTEVICLLFMFFFKDPAPCLSYFIIILLFGIELHNMVLMARQTKVFFFFPRLVIKLDNRLVLLQNFSLHL